jgi:hypothetical protein
MFVFNSIVHYGGCQCNTRIEFSYSNYGEILMCVYDIAMGIAPLHQVVLEQIQSLWIGIIPTKKGEIGRIITMRRGGIM